MKWNGMCTVQGGDAQKTKCIFDTPFLAVRIQYS